MKLKFFRDWAKGERAVPRMSLVFILIIFVNENCLIMSGKYTYYIKKKTAHNTALSKALPLMARSNVVLFAPLIQRFMTQLRSLLMHRAQLNQG